LDEEKRIYYRQELLKKIRGLQTESTYENGVLAHLLEHVAGKMGPKEIDLILDVRLPEDSGRETQEELRLYYISCFYLKYLYEFIEKSMAEYLSLKLIVEQTGGQICLTGLLKKTVNDRKEKGKAGRFGIRLNRRLLIAYLKDHNANYTWKENEQEYEGTVLLF